MWKTTIHASGVAVDDRLRTSIDRQIRDALGGVRARIGLVHVRLYRDRTGSHTCYIRVDAIPSGGIARGASASDLEGALAGAAARIGSGVRRIENGPWPGSRAPESRPPSRAAAVDNTRTA